MRLCGQIASEFGMPDLPWWIIEPSMLSFMGSELEKGYGGDAETVARAEAAIAALAPLEALILDKLEKEQGGSAAHRASGGESNAPSADAGGDTSALHRVALARLLLGACCEAYAALECSRLIQPGQRHSRLSANLQAAQLYKDACCAATWTSAHAQFLNSLINCGICPAPPGLFSVACEASEMDLSELYSHRLDPDSCASKEAKALLTIMTKCINAGVRGWDASTCKIVEEHEIVKRVLMNAFVVSVTGMHSWIHPRSRMHWTDRMLLTAYMQMHDSKAIFSSICNIAFPAREIARRLTSNTTGSALATTACMQHLSHPSSLLDSNATKLPPKSAELAQIALCDAGRAVLDEADANGSTSSIIKTLTARLTSFFSHQAQRPRDDPVQASWDPQYLGKKLPSLTKQVMPAITPAAMVFSAAFKANFLPFWKHCASHGTRAMRLDPAQHEAIHELNAATKLTLQLTTSEQLRVQRMALRTPSAGLLTLEEVAGLLSRPDDPAPQLAKPSYTIKNSVDAVACVAAYGAQLAAKILHFCRAASVSEFMLVYELGAETSLMQKEAVIKRTLVDEFFGDENSSADKLLARVPFHAKSICVCLDCKRVCNACALDRASYPQDFNEIGASSCMACVDTETGTMKLRCARRTSASVKTAMTAQEENAEKEIEALEIIEEGKSAEEGAASRARRDAKTTLEQRRVAAPCGESELLCFNLIGKVIRIFGETYCMCAFCAAFFKVGHQTKFADQLCCARCDAVMLNRKIDLKLITKKKAPMCRFCGKCDPQRSGAPWKILKAPKDTSGKNALLPPPLRVLSFCPNCCKPWVPQALKHFSTSVILAHILYGARPTYYDDEGKERVHGNRGKKRQRKNKSGSTSQSTAPDPTTKKIK